MKRIVSAFLALAVSATLVFVITSWKHGVTAVHAQSDCNAATLNGHYGFTYTGFHTPNRSVAGTEVPGAAVGVQAFDGAGNISGTYTLAGSGKISPGLTTSGVYTVNPDCTDSISFTAGAATGATFNMVIIGGGTEIFAIQTNPSTTQTLDAKKQ